MGQITMIVLDKCSKFYDGVLAHSKYTIGIFVLFVPFLYGWSYLRSYWNSYELNGNLAIALVNLDTGTYGTEIINHIKQLGLVKPSLVSHDEAVKGVKDRDYFAYIEIPKDYSQHISLYPYDPSVPTLNHPTAHITYVPNQKTSYSAYQILNKFISNVTKFARSQARRNIISISTQTLAQLPTVSDKLEASSLTAGNATFYLTNIAAGFTNLTDNLPTLVAGFSQYYQGVETFFSASTQVYEGVNSQLTQAGYAAYVSALLDEWNTVNTNSASLTTSGDAGTPGFQLNTALTTFSSSVSQIATIESQLTSGYTNFTINLQGFTAQVSESAEAASLLDGLPEFAGETVALKEMPYGTISSFGQFFSPMIVTLCLYVTTYMIYVIYYYDQWHRLGNMDKKYGSVIQDLKFIPLIILSNFFTLFMIDHCFAINPDSPALFYLGGLWAGLCLGLYVQFLNRVLDDFGKMLCVFILMLQVASCDGTLPYLVTKPFFRAMYWILPPAYSVELFREALREPKTKAVIRDIFVLFAFGALSFILTMVYEVCVFIYKKATTDVFQKNDEEEGKQEQDQQKDQNSEQVWHPFLFLNSLPPVS